MSKPRKSSTPPSSPAPSPPPPAAGPETSSPTPPDDVPADVASPVEEAAASIDPRDPEAPDQVEDLVRAANHGADPGVVLEEVGEQVAADAGDTSAMCEVTFRLPATDATQVVVAGDFNAWSDRAHPMRRTDDGFEVTVPLERGRRYLYRFVVDGRWEDDPLATEHEPNDFGERNAVCVT